MDGGELVVPEDWPGMLECGNPNLSECYRTGKGNRALQSTTIPLETKWRRLVDQFCGCHSSVII